MSIDSEPSNKSTLIQIGTFFPGVHFGIAEGGGGQISEVVDGAGYMRCCCWSIVSGLERTYISLGSCVRSRVQRGENGIGSLCLPLLLSSLLWALRGAVINKYILVP